MHAWSNLHVWNIFLTSKYFSCRFGNLLSFVSMIALKSACMFACSLLCAPKFLLGVVGGSPAKMGFI